MKQAFYLLHKLNIARAQMVRKMIQGSDSPMVQGWLKISGETRGLPPASGAGMFFGRGGGEAKI